MTDTIIGPDSNPFHINVFWLQTAKHTIRAVDALVNRVYIMLCYRRGTKRLSVHLHTECVCVFHIVWPRYEVASIKNEKFSSALLP